MSVRRQIVHGCTSELYVNQTNSSNIIYWNRNVSESFDLLVHQILNLRLCLCILGIALTADCQMKMIWGKTACGGEMGICDLPSAQTLNFTATLFWKCPHFYMWGFPPKPCTESPNNRCNGFLSFNSECPQKKAGLKNWCHWNFEETLRFSAPYVLVCISPCSHNLC